MRVRLNTLTRERRKADVQRRIHFKPVREQPAPAEPAADVDSDEPSHRADSRERASGGPTDRAHYTCSCGYVFHADVSTSVICPHCKATQAW